MTEDPIFQKKFDQMRGALLRTLRDAPKGFDPDQVLRAYAAHLQEVSPKHRCPRWELIQKAAGWSYFLRTFISDKQKLSDAIYKTDPDIIDAVAWLAQDRAKRYAQYAQEKKEKAREKELARRGFHLS